MTRVYFRRDESRPIHQSFNVVPFAIIVGKHVIEVQDVLLADELHLDTVYNKYDRTIHSLAGNLWSFCAGVRRYGLQTTEEMLKEGTVVTGEFASSLWVIKYIEVQFNVAEFESG
jgi:E3 ubiquitin-protein ligase MUL1